MTLMVVIEPHQPLRKRLVNTLAQGLPGATIEEQAALAPVHDAHNIIFDLVVLSLDINEQTECQIESALLHYHPRYILLTSTEYAPRVLSTGRYYPNVRGILLKTMAVELQLAAVRLVLDGGTCFPISDLQKVAPHDSYDGQIRPPSPASHSANASVRALIPPQEECLLLGLTPRQYEVLVLLARGYPLKTIAKHLDISVATAKTHTEALYQRLDVGNRNAAVYTAFQRGASLGW